MSFEYNTPCYTIAFFKHEYMSYSQEAIAFLLPFSSMILLPAGLTLYMYLLSTTLHFTSLHITSLQISFSLLACLPLPVSSVSIECLFLLQLG